MFCQSVFYWRLKSRILYTYLSNIQLLVQMYINKSLTAFSQQNQLYYAQTQSTGPPERPMCHQCKEFYANVDYDGLCSGCFKKLSIEESTQNPFQYQSPFNFYQPKPPDQRTSSPRASSVLQLFRIPKQCKRYGCTHNAELNCQGYCTQCFNLVKP